MAEQEKLVELEEQKGPCANTECVIKSEIIFEINSRVDKDEGNCEENGKADGKRRKMRGKLRMKLRMKMGQLCVTAHMGVSSAVGFSAIE